MSVPLREPRATQAPKRVFRADIQGLRAVAVAVVVLEHAGASWLGGGFVGVDVFFVISGFLISGHLVESLRRDGRIDLPRFYAGRARRILPAALVTVLLTAAASVLLVSPLRIVEILHDAAASAVSMPNIVFAIRETDYLAGTAPSPFQHFWSLGVEEQFYLAWPLLLMLAFWAGRRSLRVLMTVVAAVTAASFVASALTTPDSAALAFFSPHTRAWEFGVGALIAGAAPLLARVPASAARGLGWLGLALIGLATVAYGAALDYPGVAAALPVAGAALVIAFGGAPVRGGAAALLSTAPLGFLGAISYSLYLVHWPILVLVHERMGLGEPLPAWLGLLLVAVAVPVAWLLFRFVETPLRCRRDGSRRTLAVALSATAALVVALLVGASAAVHLPLTSERAAASAPLTEPPAGTAFVPENLRPALADAVADTGEIYTNGCQQNLAASAVLSCSFGDETAERTIALVGDSHAGRWFPALELAAQELGYRLDTFTKSGCRSEETVEAWAASRDASCSRWREGVVEALHDSPPDVIVFANHMTPTPDRDPELLQQRWTEGLEALRDRLPASSTVLTMADSPHFASSPVLCLSSNLERAERCAMPRDEAFNPAILAAQRAVADDRGGAVIDLTDAFCDERMCPAVIGDTLVYSDEHHLTATFSLQLAPLLTERLRPILAELP